MPAASTPNSLGKALSWLKGKVGTTGWRRKCLEIVRLTWGWKKPLGNLPTAYSGWLQTKKRHKRDYNPPPGAPCWFKGPTSAGHVCTAIGNGQVISNDWPTSNRMNKTTIKSIENGWNCEYLGWTEDYPGRGDLPLDLIGQKPPTKTYKVGDRVVFTTTVKARSGPGTESSTLTGRTVAKGYRIKITKLTEEDGYLWATADKYTYAIVARNSDKTDTHYVRKV